ncbi:copper chaperone PCu(A)C [[Pasteurella] aerogenes]|uniref:Putative DR1885-like metal-binding protein n=1 Tax=[Pasteurella] mairii TaxID=757 RepID=A0A379B723_9PAST|nr:copper chaperone PCu(A)C [[Pasteurella] mairii]SUB34272.1 putative DR1885-like metal-binding protein [[Pasteurella] mairii]
MILKIAKTSLILTALLPLNLWAKVTVENAVMYETTMANEPSAIYLTLKNSGDETVNLFLAESSVKSRLELHGMQQGKMISLTDGLAIPPQQAISLARGGAHIMVFDLQKPLKKDQQFPLTLYFDDGEKVALDVRVIAR